MRFELPLFPEQASTMAGEVDAFYFFMVAISALFSILIAFLVVFFAIRYRRRTPSQVGQPIHGGMALEVAWTVIPFLITMVMFVWSAKIFVRMNRPPDDAVQIYAVGKQWMWKVQHREGQREINELHVPLGRAVKLKMTSEDVIHSFFVPAFRTKMDVLPGRYTSIWFKPTKPGKYHLFCAEYCGTKHSGMIGWVHVMEPQEYEAWLAGGAGEGTLAQRGSKLFQDLACNNCHKADGKGRGPNLEGLWNDQVELESGEKVVADEAYLRESIISPQAKVAKGYTAVMPTFQGLVTEDQLLQLIEYIKNTEKKIKPGASPETTPKASPTR
jgi:cytochrome c oxidase subunit 2